MSKAKTETIDSKIKAAWHVVSRMYNAEANLYGGTISMAHFLLNIDSQFGAYPTEVAANLGMESTSLSRIINSLEKKKLISRSADKSDKRKSKIMLTAKGKAQKEMAKKIVRDFNHEVESKIGKQKITELFKTIDLIMNFAEERYKLIKK